MAKEKILAIIPARGGSKTVKKKNIRNLNGKPLIAYTINAAKDSGIFDKIIVSTDDVEIAEIAKQFGAEVPFIRPAAISQDETTDLPVYRHALEWLEEKEGFKPSIIAWLRPTSPLRSPEDIKGAIELLRSSGDDWVRSVCEAEHHPYWMYSVENGKMHSFIRGLDLSKYFRRQQLPPVYRLNGAVDVTWYKTIIEKQMLYQGKMSAFTMPHERSLDIDTILDFILAEEYIKFK